MPALAPSAAIAHGRDPDVTVPTETTLCLAVPESHVKEPFVPDAATKEQTEIHDVVAAARAGDELAFAALVERHRRELHVHCYRMLGSFDEAEDMVQETFLRAWRGRAGFQGGTLFRAWLYRIATNACLDTLKRSTRRVPSLNSFADIPWLTPYPDRLLDEVAPNDAQPDAVVVARETIELAYLAVIQLLPPRQRAVLILREVLDCSASETAAALETTVASVNSALQRAKATLSQRLPARQLDWAPASPSAAEREVLARFIDAHERADAVAAIALSHEDIRITMPPHSLGYFGVEEMRPLVEGLSQHGEWRLVPTSANRQPAAASYLREWDGAEFKAFKIDVLRVVGDIVTEVTTFGPELFPEFGLPLVLEVREPESESSDFVD